jgi:2-amino-4-hydroxy-6-hydroxymethyldihydropteridine diphosphokinase
MACAFIGLGSNLQNPAQQLESALKALASTEGVMHVTASPFYRSVAIGPGDQPDYVNAVAAINTSLSPIALLEALQAIEQSHGRVRGALRWTARTLDLDLLLFDDVVIESERLTVPHPHMAERNFVLRPLWDLAPDLSLPDGRAIANLLTACGDDGIAPLIPAD